MYCQFSLGECSFFNLGTHPLLRFEASQYPQRPALQAFPFVSGESRPGVGLGRGKSFPLRSFLLAPVLLSTESCLKRTGPPARQPTSLVNQCPFSFLPSPRQPARTPSPASRPGLRPALQAFPFVSGESRPGVGLGRGKASPSEASSSPQSYSRPNLA